MCCRNPSWAGEPTQQRNPCPRQLDELLRPPLEPLRHHGPHLTYVEPKPIRIEAVADLVVHATTLPISRLVSGSSASASSIASLTAVHMRTPRLSVKRSGQRTTLASVRTSKPLSTIRDAFLLRPAHASLRSARKKS